MLGAVLVATTFHGVLMAVLASSSTGAQVPFQSRVVGALSRSAIREAYAEAGRAASASDPNVEVSLETTALADHTSSAPPPRRFASFALHTSRRSVVPVATRAAQSAQGNAFLPPAPFTGVTMGSLAQAWHVGLGVATKNALAKAALSLPESNRVASQLFRDPARRRDRDVGLGPEAPVLRALCSATFASIAPVRGRAVFRAVVDEAGTVVAIDVVECDGENQAWAQAAELARTELAETILRRLTHSSRTEIRVEVTSAWKIPSGHDSGTDVSFFGEQTSKGQGVESPKVAILDVLPKVRVVELSRDLKIPIVIVDPDIFSVKGDAANAGAKPRRVVHAHLLDAKAL